MSAYERVLAEVELVRRKFPALQHGERLDWVMIPDYALPEGRYNKARTRLLFNIPPGYPNTGPDDFFVDGDLRLVGGGTAPGFNPGPNSSSGPATVPGQWGWFSWHPVSWRPAASVEQGDNLLSFLRGIRLCLEGLEQT